MNDLNIAQGDLDREPTVNEIESTQAESVEEVDVTTPTYVVLTVPTKVMNPTDGQLIDVMIDQVQQTGTRPTGIKQRRLKQGHWLQPKTGKFYRAMTQAELKARSERGNDDA